MTPVQFALSEIRARIPDDILNLAFIPKTKYRHIRERYGSTTIEEAIRRDVIDSRVRNHFDIHGAQEASIPLDGLTIQDEGLQAWSCHIPKSRTKGRVITQALGVHVGYALATGSFGFGAVGGSGIGVTALSSGCGVDSNIKQAKMLMDANKPTNLNYTANVYLINENTIYCEDRMPVSNLELRCLLASDYEFSTIQGGYVRHFADMCVLATEAYIYNQRRVIIDKAALEGGMELGVVRDYLDKYGDAEERFREFMDMKGRKMIRMSDKPRNLRYLNLLVAPGK